MSSSELLSALSTVMDRVVHHAVHRVLSPHVDRTFVFDSYSCRIGKGTHAAVNRLKLFVRRVSKNWTGACWVLKCDVAKFFDSIDHQILIERLKRKIECEKTIRLLKRIIESHRTVDKHAQRERLQGVPIGNLTSQLFANVYMDKFDHFMKEKLRIPFYIRYTDDFVILHPDPAQLEALLVTTRSYLRDQLRLNLHPQKVEIRKLRQGIDFLGYVTLPHHRVLRTRTRQRMMRRLSSMNVMSYLGLLQHADAYEMEQQIRSTFSS